MKFSLPQHSIYFSFFIYSFSLGVFFPRIADLQLQMNVGEATLGMALLGPPIGVQISLLFADLILERIGFRKTMCFGIPILGLALVFCTLSYSPVFFFTSLMFGGFAIGLSLIHI